MYLSSFTFMRDIHLSLGDRTLALSLASAALNFNLLSTLVHWKVTTRTFTPVFHQNFLFAATFGSLIKQFFSTWLLNFCFVKLFFNPYTSLNIEQSLSTRCSIPPDHHPIKFDCRKRAKLLSHVDRLLGPFVHQLFPFLTIFCHKDSRFLQLTISFLILHIIFQS